MTLGDWIVTKNLTQREAAIMLGVSRAYISLLVHGKRDPSAKLIRTIVAASQGAITAKELLEGRYV